MTSRIPSTERSAFAFVRRSGAIAAAIALFLGAAFTTTAAVAAKEDANMRLTSTSFDHGAAIPEAYTCEGKDVSPPLAWSGVPAGAKSLALIVDDPDAPDPAAPRMTWVHWVLYDIPPAATGFAQGVAPRELPQGTRDGLNDWRRSGYGGPCPPIGRHRYFFKLYALDTVLPDLGRPTKAKLEGAMKGHILEQAELLGTYQKRR